MKLDVFPGETVRLSAANLTHTDAGAITAAAVVTIVLYDPAGAVADSQVASNGGSGSDWFYDFVAPATPGTYEFKITAVANGATAKGKDSIAVVAF